MDLLQNQPAVVNAPAVAAEEPEPIDEESAAEKAEAEAPETEADYVKIPRNVFNITLTINALVIFFLVVTLYAGRNRRKDRLR
jgi:hypothetical protein